MLMPRQPRLDAPGALHHVMARGIEGTKVFKSRTDREDFLARVAKLCEAGALIVYAWALMDNHFHLLVRTGVQPLSKNMRRLLTGYVINFNRRCQPRTNLSSVHRNKMSPYQRYGGLLSPPRFYGLSRAAPG